MSRNIETDNLNEVNELLFWVEEAISKNHIKFYEYKHFSNIREIGNGNFGRVYRAKWKDLDQYLALKYFFSFDKATIKELVHELELQREVAFHDNVINFYGITTQDQEIASSGMTKNYLLVMQYADGGSLQNYLKGNFKNLTWEDKYKLAYQLACAVSCLHSEGIVHLDLYSSNILIHENKIKLADFGLSRRIETLHKQQQLDLFGVIPYIDPITFFTSGNDPNSLNEKSDVYSVGVLLWEISSGKLPFEDVAYDICLAMRIREGEREATIFNTPIEYANLYRECWNIEPDNRPSMFEVVKRLKAFISPSNIEVDNLKVIEDMDIRNSSHKKSKIIQAIQNFENTNESTLNSIDDINEVKKTLINVIVEIIFKELNEEKDQDIRNQLILDNLNSNKITLLEIYNWLLNNQNESNYIFLLGYFNYHEIGTDKNYEKAFSLFKNASEKNHILARYYVGLCYEFGNGVVKNGKLAFDSFKKIADEEHALGQFKLGYFYYKGISVKKNLKEAFNWYEKAAYNGNLIAMCNIGLMYRNGEGTNKDLDKAIYWYNESADKGNQDAQKTLNKLLKIKNRKICTVS
ncbi:uncharacterized protein OCT59_024045 [Rhizophagus irregularis]|uniref:uncharacterized protein n=1 Tax=Rhizophagus irregularis TaxID=588596 RepID=UPI000CABDFC6|nr:hypothetical protein OCT59_024045 [Rhizophagus irregularis]